MSLGLLSKLVLTGTATGAGYLGFTKWQVRNSPAFKYKMGKRAGTLGQKKYIRPSLHLFQHNDREGGNGVSTAHRSRHESVQMDASFC